MKYDENQLEPQNLTIPTFSQLRLYTKTSGVKQGKRTKTNIR